MYKFNPKQVNIKASKTFGGHIIEPADLRYAALLILCNSQV